MKHFTPLIVLLLFLSNACRAQEPGAQEQDHLAPLVALLTQVDEHDFQLDLLKGMHQALQGRRGVKAPTGWAKAYVLLAQSESAAVREKSLELALIFGDENAIALLRKTVQDSAAATERRVAAIESLVQISAPHFAPTLHALVTEQKLQRAALRGLAFYNDPHTPHVVISAYGAFEPQAKNDAIATLVSRRAYAEQLVAAMETGRIPAKEVSAFHVRQLLDFNDDALTARVETTWGKVTDTGAEIKALMHEYKQRLPEKALADADQIAGKALFQKTCGSCHVMYGEGGAIGPDLTGSNRNNLDYLFENILAPSASVAKAYQASSIQTEDGRVLSGIIGRRAGGTVVVQTATEKIILDENDIAAVRPSAKSMMPDGLIQKLTENELRDLIGYLVKK